MNQLVKELIQPLLEETNNIVALYPGKFKPPHKGHFAVAKQLLGKADEVIVVISPLTVDGITAQQSEAIWNLYKTLLGDKLIIKIADKSSPVKYVLDTVKENPNDKFIVAYGKGEGDRYKSIVSKPNVQIVDGGTISDQAGKLNATDFRNALKTNQDISRFLPDGIDKQKFLKILLTENIEEISQVVLKNEQCGCQHKQPMDLKGAMLSLTTYMIDNDMNILPLPKLKIINNDVKNAEDILGKTAYYNPSDCSITLFTLGRHPKDILRSYAHEMIHRIQDNENRLNNVNTTNTNEGGDLDQLEREAYLNGNITFRNWEDSLKNPKPVNEIYFLDSEKYNYPKTFVDKLRESLHEITLSKDNAVDVKGDLMGGEFYVGDKIYIYSIKNIPNPYNDLGAFYNVQFTPQEKNISKPTKDTNPKDYIKILSTMYKIIVDFVEKEKPKYIGIASMDNIGDKNYHTLYANLTDNKFNRIPGYFRKDVNLEFNTPQGKGRFVVLKRKDV